MILTNYLKERSFRAVRMPARCVQAGYHYAGRGYWPIVAVRPHGSDVRIDYLSKDGDKLTAVEHRDSIVNVFEPTA